MSTYAIGDIHGCLSALKAIFNHARINEDDTVVFMGDYVDRGPDSKGVLDWLIENKYLYNFKFLLGNHEIMMDSARDNAESAMEWLYFGGTQTLDSYHIGDVSNWANRIDPAHWAFIDACLPYFELDDFIFVHAGLEAGKQLEEQDHHHLFWRKYETPEQYHPKKTVICGHTSRKNGAIADFGHTICIDTYAYGGMWLSCLDVETRAYIQANNNGEIKAGQL